MKEKSKKKRVLARLLAEELKVVRGGALGPTVVKTGVVGDKFSDLTNLEWDNDGPLDE